MADICVYVFVWYFLYLLFYCCVLFYYFFCFDEFRLKAYVVFGIKSHRHNTTVRTDRLLIRN